MGKEQIKQVNDIEEKKVVAALETNWKYPSLLHTESEYNKGRMNVLKQLKF